MKEGESSSCQWYKGFLWWNNMDEAQFDFGALPFLSESTETDRPLHKFHETARREGSKLETIVMSHDSARLKSVNNHSSCPPLKFLAQQGSNQFLHSPLTCETTKDRWLLFPRDPKSNGCRRCCDLQSSWTSFRKDDATIDLDRYFRCQGALRSSKPYEYP